MAKDPSYLKYLFETVELEGKTILDVGAGGGDISSYMAENGADHVVSLEPEGAGSDYDAVSYEKLKERAEMYPAIEPISKTFQDYQSKTTFDLIVLHNVVNHLHEDHCIQLQESEESQSYYLNQFQKLRSLTRSGGLLMISDSAPTSLWSILGFAPHHNIEWEKHQNPEVWASLLSQTGFSLVDKRWTPIFRGPLSRRLTENWPTAFLRSSHFTLEFEAI